MADSPPVFQFSDGAEPTVVGRAIRLPRGIASKTRLLQEFAVQCEFPSYFGGNWDAFDECLNDLSWLADDGLSVVHEDLPLAATLDDQAIYLAILQDAVTRRRESGRGELTVIFPKHFTREVLDGACQGN